VVQACASSVLRRAGAVSNEGMWWEGENYHFFALRSS